MERRDELCSEIIDLIDSAVQCDEEYAAGDEMADMAFYMWENKITISDLDHLDGETKIIVNQALALGMSETKIIDALKEVSKVELHGIYHPDNNYLQSWCLGEREVEVDGLQEKLSRLTDAEFDYIKHNCNAHITKKSTDLIYHDMSYNVYYLRPDLDKLYLLLGAA